MAEARIVVENREHLWFLLAQAAHLEHMVMCQYLFAAFTLRDDEDLTPEQAAAVGRWRGQLHDIAVEEMLHLALVANVMSAIGAAPTFTRANFPQGSAWFPPGLQMRLLPFGDDALKHFLFLERPEGMDREDVFTPGSGLLTPLGEDEAFPRMQDFGTVGHLYRGIEDGLRRLAGKLGERVLFCGNPRAQATPELFRWPELIAVTDLASACAAIEEIIEQGEGARGDWRDAHYGRFLVMYEEYQALGFQAAHPALPTFVRQPFDVPEPQPLINDPATLEVAEQCNLAYEVVLQILLRFFTHTDETDEQLETLIGAAIGLMADVLRPLGTALTRMPAGADYPGRTAGPAFEMYYLMTNTVPWREPAWILLVERLEVLRARCPGPIADRVATTIAALSEHVPAELRRP
jgi:hypothetical protein